MAGIDTAWVLSGGGANGAYQNGGIQRFAEAVKAGDLKEPDAVIGTSVGSLNGERLCEHPVGQFEAAAEAVDAEWARLKGNKDIYKSHFWGLLPSALLMFVLKTTRGLNSTKPLQAHVRKNMDPEKLVASGRHFACNAIEVGHTSEARWFETGDPHIVEGVLASSAFPIFFDPIKIEGKWYTDGGLRDVTAIGKAIELGAKDILVISCSPGRLPDEKAPKGLDYLLRSVEILLDEVDQSDFAHSLLINELVRAGSPLATVHGWRVVDLKALRPSGFLGDSLDFSPAKNTELRTLGYEDAERFLQTL